MFIFIYIVAEKGSDKKAAADVVKSNSLMAVIDCWPR